MSDMKQQKIEYVMSSDAREQMARFLGEIPGKYCVPLLNMLNEMERRSVAHADDAHETVRSD